MTKSQPQDEPTRALVKCFCSFIFRLKLLHYIYCELFEDDSALYLTEQTADAFFFDLSNILVDYFLLEVAKLTDPATSLSGKCENFTIANLIETIEWPADCLQKIEELNETVQLFRTYIKPARNKLLAHYDKKAVISGATFGGFPEGKN